MGRNKSKDMGRDAMSVVHPNAAAIDVGATMHTAAVNADRTPEPVRSFGTFTSDLHRLVEWLVECGVDTVVMESTSVFWIPIFELLDARGFAVFAVALLKAGQRVATIDLDCRQQTLTRYIKIRRAWASRMGLELELPVHVCVERGETMHIAENEAVEFRQFAGAISHPESRYDFLVIDTPGTDSYLMRLAHLMADTLITPLNDSFLDFDVLGTVDPTTYAVTGRAHYAEMVQEARRRRRQLDGTTSDWIVVRNRLSMLGSRNRELVADCLKESSLQLGFRPIDGLVERAVYREFFPKGLTALDFDKATLGARGIAAHAAARQEMKSLLPKLELPLDDRGRRRAANRAEWFRQVGKQLETNDIFSA